MITRTAGRPVRLTGLTILLLSLLALTAAAHPILQNPCWIEVSPEVLRVKLCVSLREFAVVQGASADADGRMDLDEVRDAARRHVPYVLSHLQFAADGRELTGTVTSWEPPEEVELGPEGPDRTYCVYRLEYPLPEPPGLITFRHNMVEEFPSSPGVPWDFSYAYRFGVPGEPAPRQFGALPRDREAQYATGYREVPASARASAGQPEGADGRGQAPAARGMRSAVRTGAIALFWIALAINFRGARPALHMLGWCAAAFGTAYAAAASAGGMLPASLTGTAAGAGILLLAADNIHHVWEPPGRRRHALGIAFAAIQGVLAARLPAGDGSAEFGAGVLAASAGLFCLVALLSSGLRRRARTPERLHPFMQIVSLSIAAGGVHAVLTALQIRPPWSL